jgi:hypothetical protein
MLLVAFLMMANWGIEAVKWKIAMKGIMPVTLRKGMKAIFAGNALAFFTPNRTGEYLGRMIYVQRGERLSSISSSIICSIAQLMVTLFAGFAGLAYMRGTIAARFGAGVMPWLNVALCVVLATATVLTIFYFRIHFIVKWMSARRWARSWARHVGVLEDVNATILTSILSLSIARYVVFIVQYYLLFSVFAIDVNWWQAFWAVSVVFLVIAVIPSLGFLSELGIRWQAGIQVMQLFSSAAV